MVVFVCALLSASFVGSSVGLLQGPLPLVFVLVAAGDVAMLVRPEAATVIFAFALYMNVPDVSVTSYDVPFVIAAGFVVLPAIPIGSFWLSWRPLLTRTPAVLPLLAFTAVAAQSAVVALAGI